MNKMTGLQILKELGLRTPDIKFYVGEELDPNRLWTIRTVSKNDSGFNLPRSIGKGIEHALETIKLIQSNPNWKVIYNPFFTADYSGMLDINSQRIVIELCDKDSWNLETLNRPDVTLIYSPNYKYTDDRTYNQEFLGKVFCDSQFILIRQAIEVVKVKLKGFLESNYSLNIGFSFGWYDGDKERYLIFHDLRVVK